MGYKFLALLHSQIQVWFKNSMKQKKGESG
jgi:hypothetical protein